MGGNQDSIHVTPPSGHKQAFIGVTEPVVVILTML